MKEVIAGICAIDAKEESDLVERALLQHDLGLVRKVAEAGRTCDTGLEITLNPFFDEIAAIFVATPSFCGAGVALIPFRFSGVLA